MDRRLVQEADEVLATAGLLQLADCFRLNLANAFASHFELSVRGNHNEPGCNSVLHPLKCCVGKYPEEFHEGCAYDNERKSDLADSITR